MDAFTNIFTPISYWTDINSTLAAYNNSWYTNAVTSANNYIFNLNSNYTWDPFGYNFWNPFSSQNYSTNQYNYNCYPYIDFRANQHYDLGYSVDSNTTTKAKASGVSKPNSTNATSTPKTSPQRQKPTEPSKIAKSFVSNAVKYVGFNEADGSYKKFTNSTEWCADFVTYVVKESYKQQGLTPPSWFGSWRCEDLKQQAIEHNKFIKIAGEKNKELIVRRYVKPGDIVILRENGASHTGIVKEINRKNGEFITVEGNIPNRKGVDSVYYNYYEPHDKEISGFIQLA